MPFYTETRLSFYMFGCYDLNFKMGGLLIGFFILMLDSFILMLDYYKNQFFFPVHSPNILLSGTSGIAVSIIIDNYPDPIIFVEVADT